MLFDTQFMGFYAVGSDIFFRPIAGEPVQVLTCPEDVDSHTLVEAFNSNINSVYLLAKSFSSYKF